MATKSTSNFAVILGIGLAFLIGVVILASPFYLGLLRPEDRALEAASQGEVEAVRRAVLNLDENLAALADANAASVAGSDELDANDEELAAQKDVLAAETMRSLDQTAAMLREVESSDQLRGTTITGPARIQTGRPNVRAAATEIKIKYLAAHEKGLREAENVLNNLNSLVVGSTVAKSSLATARIRSILQYCKGRVAKNRAEFERWQASMLRREASQIGDRLVAIQRSVADLEAQKPDGAIKKLDERMAVQEQSLAKLKGELSTVDQVVATKQSELSQLESQAAASESQMTSLKAQAFNGGTLGDQYTRVSDNSRRLQAQASALKNGTLDGGSLLPSASGQIEPPVYDGGTSSPGLRDLEFTQETLNEQKAILESSIARLNEEKTKLENAAEEVDKQVSALSQSLDSGWESAKALLTQAETHDSLAVKAEEDAVKSFKDAATSAAAAVSAASRRTNDARSAATAGGGEPDERLLRVGNDGDLEAAMQCLVAEIATQVAVTRMGRLDAEQEKDSCTALIDESEPVSTAADKLAEIRNEANNKLTEAFNAYEQAAKRISATSAKFDSTTVSGKNYLWQVQVAQAAVQLLRSALVMDSAESAAAREQAYKLLVDAAKGREQSPLLLPATETLLYIQQSAD